MWTDRAGELGSVSHHLDVCPTGQGHARLLSKDYFVFAKSSSVGVRAGRGVAELNVRAWQTQIQPE